LSRYTVDSSVAIKWFIPETGSESAVDLLKEDLIAPDLLFAEIGNILWKKVVRKEISEDVGHSILAAFSRGPIEIRSSGSGHLLDLALAISNEAEITFYDALYVSLAASEGPRLVTADRKLLRKLENTRFASHVLSLEALP
jgi:predicted nucleic acid-binding protein